LPKIIFLDIEGVLVSQRSCEKLGNDRDFDPDTVALLRDLVADHDAKIVIIAARRKDPAWPGNVLEPLARAGWPNPPIIGATPVVPGATRGVEIREWLRENGDIRSYVIIDDNIDLLPDQLSRLVRCDEIKGFTPRRAAHADAMLRRS
jgi:hypothetical protein